ncbi:hypothetical protein [Mycobacterium sp. 236(2023)]|uniref:hypothetical protein n=1 Tax=Mycobacterium sp. 236(2023) TaxID=3038163 RepID=UPI002414EB5D|nr:hypothetical protein [Mycobacterium sp. 236(2023)]MDG4668866.1 hypothetical protein [Mycobacterium sp. 236(2023)]
MTTAEQMRDAVTRPASSISIAGVAWPVYKVVALLMGLLVFVVVAAATTSAAPAVLTATGITVLAWVALGAASRIRG